MKTMNSNETQSINQVKAQIQTSRPPITFARRPCINFPKLKVNHAADSAPDQPFDSDFQARLAPDPAQERSRAVVSRLPNHAMTAEVFHDRIRTYPHLPRRCRDLVRNISRHFWPSQARRRRSKAFVWGKSKSISKVPRSTVHISEHSRAESNPTQSRAKAFIGPLIFRRTLTASTAC